MLNKSILLNLNMVKQDMGTLAGVLICFLVILLIGINSFAFPALGCLAIYLVVRLVMFIRIINKVFFYSFFDQEGTMYMTLPIPAKDMVLGKILATSGYFFLIDIFFIIGSFLIVLITGGNAQDFLTSLSGDLPSLEGSPLELTLAFGLLPFSVFADTVTFSALTLSIFLKFGLQKKKLVLCWIIYGIVQVVLSFLLEQASELLSTISFGAAIDSGVEIIFYLGLTYVLVRYCINCLEKNYQV